MLRKILSVGGWTMASRILGLVREILIAALLGTGPVADAFFVALKLPNLFRRLFGEGAFNAAFVPSFTGKLAAEGEEAARRFAEEAFAVLSLWLLVLTVLGEIFMPGLMAVLAPGFEKIPAKFALAVTLSRITFPYLILICAAALLAGVLNGIDRFTAAAASYVLFNVIGIAALFGLTPYLPTAGHAMAIGVTASGIAQLAMLAWALHRAGFALRPRMPRLSPDIRLLMRRMLPGLIGAGVTQVNFAVDVIIASLLPAGTVSVLNYADRINQLPLGVIGTAIGTALLPTLARQMRLDQHAEAKETLNRALEFGLFLTLPAAMALIVVPFPIIWVLFGHGAFGLASAVRSAQSLAAYALGLPAFVAVKVLAPGFFARGDTKTPVAIGAVAVAVNLALNLAFMVPLRHVGPALATSLAAALNAALLGWVLHRRGVLAPDAQLRRRLPRMAAAAAAMAVVLFALARVEEFTALHGAVKLAALALLVGVGLGAYLLAAWRLGAFSVAEVGRMLRRRR